MSESPYPVGYGRPPDHTRFRKGQSGNPSGKPGPKKLTKLAFDAAINDALNEDEAVLRQAQPAKAVASFARQVVLLALDGQPSAQRLLLSILDREDDAAAGTGKGKRATISGIDENCRELLGDRYDEFKNRYDAAVRAGSVDQLVALVEDFDCTDKFPAAGNSAGNF
jgi:hypothetical protein